MIVLLLGYLALPFDLVPDFIPVAGQLDDALAVALTLRFLLRSGGAEVLAEHWPGPPESLRLIVKLAWRRGEQREGERERERQPFRGARAACAHGALSADAGAAAHPLDRRGRRRRHDDRPSAVFLLPSIHAVG
ncbi:MAG: hypothetical protein QOE28_2446 [Solirubrobacteraceae bacterium]|nr:hypothetical protein [Solirubrobacteraceae bacterium]